MTAALEGGEWSAALPGRTLPPGKTRYPFYRWLGGPQGRSGRAEYLVPTGIRSRTVQPVVSRYTDWATLPTVALGTQREIRMRHIVICGLSGCIIFLHIISQTVRFSKNIIEHKMCVLIFSTTFLSERYLILRTERDTIKNVSWSSCKVPVILSDFNETWIFSTFFFLRKTLKYKLSWKSDQWEPSCSMRTDWQTGRS